jgi:hypothetical protein
MGWLVLGSRPAGARREEWLKSLKAGGTGKH